MAPDMGDKQMKRMRVYNVYYYYFFFFQKGGCFVALYKSYSLRAGFPCLLGGTTRLFRRCQYLYPLSYRSTARYEEDEKAFAISFSSEEVSILKVLQTKRFRGLDYTQTVCE